MKRIATATLLLFVLGAVPASAAMDCGSMLDKMAGSISSMGKASAEKRAALRRMALAGYDHCMAGDEFNAEKFWKMIADQAR